MLRAVYIDITVFLCFEFILGFSFFERRDPFLLKKSYLFILSMQNICNRRKSR